MMNPHVLERNLAPDLLLRLRHLPTSVWDQPGCTLPRRVPVLRLMRTADIGARP